MKKMARRTLSTVLALLMLLGGLLAGFTVSAATISGTLNGGAITWSLDTDTGEMIVQGDGWLSNSGLNILAGYEQHLRSLRVLGNIGIGSAAFINCRNLYSVILEEGVWEIDSYAFYGCTALEVIVIPSSCTSVFLSAFDGINGSEKLSELILPEGVQYIYDKVPYGIEYLSLPSTLREIPEGAFSAYLHNIRIELNPQNPYFTLEDNVLYNKKKTRLIDYPAIKQDISYVIPNTVTQIDAEAFRYNGYLQTLIISDSVTNIASHLFSSCENLETVILPSALANISNDAFSGCKSLSNLVLPTKLTNVGYNAFSGCESLENVIVPDSVTDIGERAFYNCSNLRSVALSNSMKTISVETFKNCTSLSNVVIPQGIKNIGGNSGSNSGAFYNCRALLQIELPDSVTQINEWAFSGSGLIDIKFPESVSMISSLAFAYCKSLEKIELSNNTKVIDDSAFIGCPKLTVLCWPDSYARQYAIANGFRYDAPPHTHNEVVTSTMNGTCTTLGKKTYQCTLCGAEREETTQYLHNPKAIITTAPTCTAVGTGYEQCTVCNLNLGSITIPATGHTAQHMHTAATCTSNGEDHDSCSVCGIDLGERTILPATGHSFGTWQITQQETNTQAGTKTSSCSKCTARETRLYKTLAPGQLYDGFAYNPNVIVYAWENDNPAVATVERSATASAINQKWGEYNTTLRERNLAIERLTNALGFYGPGSADAISYQNALDNAQYALDRKTLELTALTNHIKVRAGQTPGTAIITAKSTQGADLAKVEIIVSGTNPGGDNPGGDNPGGGNTPAKKYIFSTKYEATVWNWIMFFLLFGFIWMWF